MVSKLNALREKRLKWVHANRENGFDEGINHLLTELYPDNAHFIYELLQNAEDPKATKVSFDLTGLDVRFKHNGKRLFDLKDVDSITSIGNSTKRDDPTSIGKFGVGFKAVFAYTSTPEIHSGDYHFQIHDLVVPETDGIDVFDSGDSGYSTQFIFPFDNPKKPSLTAVSEIEKGLRNLGDNTLLFLSNIREINYTLQNGEQGAIKRFDHDNGRIDIQTLHPNGQETISHWLHFQKEVDVIDDGKAKQCNIAIAYSLTEERIKKDQSTIWKIVPLDHGQVSIYFPAEKETSNLRFHLHAPFASTVARDSVRDCNANNQLRDGIAELIVESLFHIRDQGFLTVSFLAVLPNPRDNLTKFYQPIQLSIITAFQKQALTPTKNKSHSKSLNLYQGPVKITNVIDNKDLVILTEYTGALWVANPPPQSQREEAFLNSLDIDTWGWDELSNIFNYKSYEAKTSLENWLQFKPEKWLIGFYALLGEAISSQRKTINVKHLKIVLIETEGINTYVFPSEAYFPAIEGVTPPPNTPIVNKLTYDSGRSDENKLLARLFLEKIGVRPFDIKALIEYKLAEYRKQSQIQLHIPESYLSDIKVFVDYWRETSDTTLFKSCSFLCGRSKNGYVQFQLAHELYLDKPFADTGLHNLFNDTSITLEKYKLEILDEYQTIAGFTDFAVALGVMNQLEIAKSNATSLQESTFVSKCNRITNTTIDVDYFINSLAGGWKRDSNYFIGTLSLASKKLVISYAIWKTVCKAKPEQLIAYYLPNQKNQHLARKSNAQFIEQLKSGNWLPDRNCNFFTPAELTIETLHPDFIYDDRNGWLTAIGFGSGQRHRDASELTQDLMAVSEGFFSHSHKVKCVIAIKAGFDPDAYLEKIQPIEFPEKRVPNPERRKRNVLDLGANAPTSESVARERAIKPYKKGVTDQAKAYLRHSYTNVDDQLPCQCCRQEMPFRLYGEDNLHYFEAVQCISGLEAHYKENALALCPTCAAMYKYACSTKDDEIEELILEYDNNDDSGLIVIPVVLAGKQEALYFVEAHWFDLKTILEN